MNDQAQKQYEKDLQRHKWLAAEARESLSSALYQYKELNPALADQMGAIFVLCNKLENLIDLATDLEDAYKGAN